jgi:hypothetical protein
MPPRIAEVSWKAIGWVLGLVICNPISVFGMNAVQFVAAPEWLRPLLIGLFGLGMAAFYGWFVLLFWLPGRFLREVFGDRERDVLLTTLVGALLVWGTFPIGMAVYEYQRAKGLALVRKQAQPIIVALDAFKTNTGKYPAQLSELVPECLFAVPRNGLSVFPDFHYSPATEHTLYRSYELSIPTPRGMMSFDRYVFWPERKYPKVYRRNGLEPIGDWAFMYE